MERDKGLLALGILLVLVPLIPGSNLMRVASNPLFVTVYPDRPISGATQYEIWYARNHLMDGVYYVAPYWTTEYEFGTLQDCYVFIDGLNEGTVDPTANIVIKVVDKDGDPVNLASVNLQGVGTKTTAGGFALWLDLPLKTYSYTVSKAGYQVAQGAVSISEGGTTNTELVILTKTAQVSDPDPDKTTIIIQASQGGTTDPSGTLEASIGEVVTVSAAAEAGYSFSHWVLNDLKTGLAEDFEFTVREDVMYKAVFTSRGDDPDDPVGWPVGYYLMAAGVVCIVAGIADTKRK